MRFDIWHTDEYGTATDLQEAYRTLEEAAQALELDPSEIEWAIEEFGRCDVSRLVAVPAGTQKPKAPQDDRR